jgi:lysyl-tRNA synthetase class 2
LAERPNISDWNEQIQVRYEKALKMRERGLNPYPNGFNPRNLSSEILQKFESTTREELEGQQIRLSVAGRVMAVRDFGKGGFVRIQDRKGLIQLFVSKDVLAERYETLKEFMDLGDHLFAEGTLFRTKTNELTIKVESFAFAGKALRPLPEKFHGLADVETRYRHRSVDLIANPTVRRTFEARSRIISFIRRFFDERDFLEVDTPMMHSIAGGAAARPFKTHHNALDMDLYLRIAPELHLKRLIVGGFERVYELNRLFRNEGISVKHNPEFSTIEFYWAYATYEDLMTLTEELFLGLAREICGTSKKLFSQRH